MSSSGKKVHMRDGRAGKGGDARTPGHLVVPPDRGQQHVQHREKRDVEATRDALLHEYLPLIARIALRSAEEALSFEDLFQEGVLAFLEMIPSLSARDPRHFRSRVRYRLLRHMATVNEQHACWQREDTTDACDERVFCDRQASLNGQLHQFQDAPPCRLYLSLDVPLSARLDEQEESATETDDEPEVFADRLVDGSSLEETVLLNERNRLIHELLRGLPERDLFLLCTHFGLYGWPVKTLEEQGRMLHISREKVRQKLQSVLQRIRKKIRGSPEDRNAWNALDIWMKGA